MTQTGRLTSMVVVESVSLPDKSRSDFARLSFSGAYGHLIHIIAQYQLWKQNRRDWQVKREAHVDGSK